MGIPQSVIADAASKNEIDFPSVEAEEANPFENDNGEFNEDAADGIGQQVDGLDQEDDGEWPDDAPPQEAAEEESEATDADNIVDDPSEPQPEEDEIARLAALAESEAATRRASNDLRKREQELQQAQQNLQQQQQQIKGFMQNLRENPYQALEQVGIPFDSLLEEVVQNEGHIPEGTRQQEQMPGWAQQMQEQLTSLVEENRSLKAAKQEDSNKNQYLTPVREALKGKDYSLLRETYMGDIESTVYDLAVEHFNETGEVLPAQSYLDKMNETWRGLVQNLPNHAEALQIMGFKDAPARKQNRQQSSGRTADSETLTGDMPRGRPQKKKRRSREDDIADAASRLKGSPLWADLEDED